MPGHQNKEPWKTTNEIILILLIDGFLQGNITIYIRISSFIRIQMSTSMLCNSCIGNIYILPWIHVVFMLGSHFDLS